jgi:hypothetical protein
MRYIGGVLILLLSAAAPRAMMVTTINFESLPNANIAGFCGGGGNNIGTFYSGVTMGADVEGVSSDCVGSGYPPHSGTIEAFSFNDFVTITFSSTMATVSVYYTALDPIILTAFDSGNNVLTSSTGLANTDGSTGSNTLLSVTHANIKYVTIGNVGLADEYTFDDLSFSAVATPEPSAAVLFLLGCLSAVALWAYRRSASVQPKSRTAEARVSSAEDC